MTREMMTGKSMNGECVEREWQEFVLSRQSSVDRKLEYETISSEYGKVDQEIKTLLSDLPDKKVEALNDAILAMTSLVSYAHYNKGFFDGVKIAMVMGEL